MSRAIILYIPPKGFTSKNAAKQGWVEHEGRIYMQSRYYIDEYDVNSDWLYLAKENGLPHIQYGKGAYINEQDFRDYCAGKIGGSNHGYGMCGD